MPVPKKEPEKLVKGRDSRHAPCVGLLELSIGFKLKLDGLRYICLGTCGDSEDAFQRLVIYIRRIWSSLTSFAEFFGIVVQIKLVQNFYKDIFLLEYLMK